MTKPMQQSAAARQPGTVPLLHDTVVSTARESDNRKMAPTPNLQTGSPVHTGADMPMETIDFADRPIRDQPASGRSHGPLREGFTTGSAATAAAVAALRLLLFDDRARRVDIPVPPQAIRQQRLIVPIDKVCRISTERARAEVVKDAGDDPDITHLARIRADVSLTGTMRHDAAHAPDIGIRGGRGVGRVTLPGLPVPIGQAAINPAPLAQIRRAVSEICSAAGYTQAIDICISVPEGASLARHTLNPRLGIIGGISILGTQGIVRPFSHTAWQQTIVRELAIAGAVRCRHIALSTGGRSEHLLTMALPDLPEQAFVQIADFVGFAVREIGRNPQFTTITWGCFFGKLLKAAQGHTYTHAHTCSPDMRKLAELCHQCSLPEDLCRDIQTANTAGQALDLILSQPQAHDILDRLLRQACSTLQQCIVPAGRHAPVLRVLLFHMDGTVLASHEWNRTAESGRHA